MAPDDNSPGYDSRVTIILYAIPGFIVLILIEWVYGLARGRNTYRIADTITSISLGSLSRLRGLVFLGLGSWFYQKASGDYRLFELPDSGPIIWIFALIAYDFSYYWFHRVSHEVNLFWAAHVVHHQSEDYNLGTALRQSGSGLFGFVFYLPWLVVGIPPAIFFASGAINLVYQFWVHTQHVKRLGPLEYILITPSNHRVHHAQNPIYIDRNYGGILCIWDRLFGTFQDELDSEPCIYGIRKPLHSYNPFWANFHVYWGTLLDSWRTERWADKLRIWFKDPGWRPADLAAACPVEKVDLDHFRKYDPPAPLAARLYAFFQFVCFTLATTGLLVVSRQWDSSQVWLATILVGLGFYVQALFTEGRRYAAILEVVKLLLVFLAADYLPLGPVVGQVVLAYLLVSALCLAVIHWPRFRMLAGSS
jgi:sterol desaturase/sphingolipid hydroxylase (fatty acid hydroxylase superfamily)